MSIRSLNFGLGYYSRRACCSSVYFHKGLLSGEANSISSAQQGFAVVPKVIEIPRSKIQRVKNPGIRVAWENYFTSLERERQKTKSTIKRDDN